MASTTLTFAPHQPSPLARTISPFKDPRTPPSTPGKTAKLWDEYERRAVENVMKREGGFSASQLQRSSASDIPRTSATLIASARSSFDFKFRSRATSSSPSHTAICKTCKQPITYASGICKSCKKTVILSATSGESTPPLSPAARNFALANTVSPLSPAVHIPTHAYTRHNSATPSDGSTLYPHTSRTASVNTVSYGHPAASAWDDWDSDGESEKAGFLWKGIKPGKDRGKKKERSDSKASVESMTAKLSFAREEERKKSREQWRSGESENSGKKGKVRRSRGFVRVLSCGGCGED
ncbi:hypothetical protein CC86DRAFT_396210 [Ophiobolus disseminans]|uniref:Uncharacterized protein n=1 Tax=Ophiobolus disseminans TaxID=1469910 RepID=A0A6A6ZRL1_9PLEO|nr:hypothetical protein CC86DRAFT_396210 [Ophiobolus disseminans]